MNTVISVENLSKQYDLGVIGTGTLSRDLNRWWARVRGLPDPYTRIGQKDAFERIGESILALDDVSFTVQQGEALGIIGRNGAGKSTLLKILSRVTAPTSGVVKVKGRIGSLLEVGTGFHPELTGRENVYLNGAILGMRKEEVTEKFDEIVDFSGVEKFIDTPVKRYSSGMYVRLAFAVAAHLDPEILIVDEVLAVGDAEFQKKCLGKMGDVAGEGRTVLFVSHNMTAIENLCTNSVLFDEGRITTYGQTERVIGEYLANNYQVIRLNDLSDRHVHRQGSGDGRFTGVKLFSQNNEDVTQVGLGENLNFLFEIFGNKDLLSLEVALAIFDKKNIRVVGINSRDLNNFTFDIKEKERKSILCCIPKQNLAPGMYYVNILLKESGKEVVDYVQRACFFELLPSDYFGSGKLPKGESIILLKANWEELSED